MLSDLAEDAKNFGRSVGRDGFRRVLEDIFTTFPDWHVEINLAEFFWTPAVVKTAAADSERSSSLLRVVEIDKRCPSCCPRHLVAAVLQLQDNVSCGRYRESLQLPPCR